MCGEGECTALCVGCGYVFVGSTTGMLAQYLIDKADPSHEVQSKTHKDK